MLAECLGDDALNMPNIDGDYEYFWRWKPRAALNSWTHAWSPIFASEATENWTGDS
jgi:hypothetical protein